MWPREHGTYVQLLAPLTAALIAVPTVAGALIAFGAFAAFLGHEALLVATGGRGKRAKAQNGALARRRFALLGGTAVAVGVAGLSRAPVAAWLISASVAVPALGAAWLAHRRRIHDFAGEVCATVALVGPCAVVSVAGGRSIAFALVMWAAWSAAYVVIVAVAQHMLATHRAKRAGGATPVLVRLKRLGIAMTVTSAAAAIATGLLA